MDELTVTNDIDMNTDLIDDTLDSVDMIDDESLNEEVEEMNANLKNNMDKRNKLKKDLSNRSTYDESLNEDFEPFFFDEEDTSGFRSDAQSLINKLNVIDYMDDYDSFRDFVDNEFSAKLLGAWGSNQEMDELFRYFIEQSPEQAKIGKRIWKDSSLNEDWDVPAEVVEAQSPSMSSDVRDMHAKDKIRRKKLDADNKNALDKNFKFDKMEKFTLDESLFIKRR